MKFINTFLSIEKKLSIETKKKIPYCPLENPLINDEFLADTIVDTPKVGAVSSYI